MLSTKTGGHLLSINYKMFNLISKYILGSKYKAGSKSIQSTYEWYQAPANLSFFLYSGEIWYSNGQKSPFQHPLY